MSQFRLRSRMTTRSIPEVQRQIGFMMMAILAAAGIFFDTVRLIMPDFEVTLYAYAIAGLCLLGIYLLRFERIQAIALQIPTITLLAVFLAVNSESSYFILIAPLLIYSAITSQIVVYLVVNVVVLIVAVIHQQTGTVSPFVGAYLGTTLMSSSVYLVIHSFHRLTGDTQQLNQLLQAGANVGQVINSELDLKQLFDTTVNIIRESYKYYHVQVFLVDDRHEFANLVASTGEPGKILLARKHRLPVGSKSVIGRVTQVGEPVVAQNTAVDTVHAINELLPDTRAELALPIIDSNNIIGALDVQSVHADAFQQVDIQALQIIANQLGVAIRNARLFEEAQRNISENNRLLYDYETNLREIERLNRTLTAQSWDSYISQELHISGVTLDNERFIPRAEWSDTMRKATENQQPTFEETDHSTVVAVPIILRGQVLGAIEIDLTNKSQAIDSVEVVQAISQRLAISLESARLFEDTQEASLQEQQINEIVSSYETAITVDELLQVTLEKLQQSLGADKGTIRLGTLNDHEPINHNHNGGSHS